MAPTLLSVATTIATYGPRGGPDRDWGGRYWPGPAGTGMHWGGPFWGGPGPWWLLVPLVWLLVVAAVVALVARFGRRRMRDGHGAFGPGPFGPAGRPGEARLAERYAGGEIDEDEYERRLATLRQQSP